MDFLDIHATALDSLTSINSLGGIERRTLSQHYKRKGLVTVTMSFILHSLACIIHAIPKGQCNKNFEL